MTLKSWPLLRPTSPKGKEDATSQKVSQVTEKTGFGRWSPTRTSPRGACGKADAPSSLLDNQGELKVEAIRAKIADEEVVSMQLTWADRLEAKGREEGLQEGLQKGLQRGLQRGRLEGGLRSLKDIVLRQLAQRFGRLPVKVRRRIEAIESLELLERIAGEILTIGSLAELRLD